MCKLIVFITAAVFVSFLVGCVVVPTQNKYCDNVSWLCGDSHEPVCIVAVNTCVPVGYQCYDNDGTLAHYTDPNTQNDPNFSHCGPVMDAGTSDMTHRPDLLPPPPDLSPPPDMTPSLHFNPDIQSDLDAKGCAVPGCHAYSTGLYAPLIQAMPSTTVLIMNNYNAFLVDSQNGDNSLALTKPLMGSGVTHAGGKAFASTSDPMYVRWQTWIREGSRY